LGAIRAEAKAGAQAEIFLSGEQRATSPTSGRPNFTKIAHKTWIYVANNRFGKHFRNLPVRGIFSKKSSKDA